jgi:hypothetical protein
VSFERTVSSIARNAGDETVDGLNAPPLRRMNWAGSFAFVAPPAGLEPRLLVLGPLAEPGDEEGTAVDTV